MLKTNNINQIYALFRNIMVDNFNSSKILFHSIKNGGTYFTIQLQLKLLTLQGNVDIDVRDLSGFTPILRAANLNRRNIVELLINYGANVDCCDNRYKWTVLHYACQDEWTDMAQSLVKRVIDLNAKDVHGETALHVASFFGHLGIVKCLVEEGADINAIDHQGATPLIAAAYASKRDAADLLLKAGANVNICDHEKNTLLHYASQIGNEWLEVIQSFVNRVPDINVRNTSDQTPLLLACQYQNLDVVEYLFQADANCDIADTNGNTPLHYLIKMGRSSVKLIKLFMENVAGLLPADCDAILNSSVLRRDILQDVTFCCRVIVNKFNNRDLTNFYKLPMTESLPPIEKIQIVSCTNVFQTIKQTVRFEIRTKGYCNPFKVCPAVLKVLCVKSVLEYYDKKNFKIS